VKRTGRREEPAEVFRGIVATIGELLRFLAQRRLWWMLPLVTMLLVVGLLVVLASTTGLGPFIYTLF
jgi:hypothetical protein